MDQDKRIKNRLGDHCSYVCDHPNKENLIIVSDGEYEYQVSKRSWIRRLTYRTMTDESRIKRWDKLLPPELRIVSVEKYFLDVYATLEYIPNGNLIKRILRLDKIGNILEKAKREADPTGYYKEKCILKYGDKFDLSKVIYNGYDKEVAVICPVHGEFLIEAKSFLIDNKFGCPKCGMETNHGFSRKTFLDGCENGIGYIYILECVFDEEHFIKIGVTSKSNMKDRFGRREWMPYKFDVIFYKSGNAESIFNLEHEVHRRLKEYKYRPQMRFNGVTECFDISIKPQAISLIEELLVSLPKV